MKEVQNRKAQYILDYYLMGLVSVMVDTRPCDLFGFWSKSSADTRRLEPSVLVPYAAENASSAAWEVRNDTSGTSRDQICRALKHQEWSYFGGLDPAPPITALPCLFA